jgi:hypothetical protein
MQTSKKLRDGAGMSGSSNQHPETVIKDFANQSRVARETPYSWPEANTLDCSADTNFDSLPKLHHT